MRILSQLKNTFERETNSEYSLMGRIGWQKKGKRLLQRLTTEFPADPGQDLHTQVYSGHRWKQPKCPLMKGCRKSRWSIHTMEHPYFIMLLWGFQEKRRKKHSGSWGSRAKKDRVWKRHTWVKSPNAISMIWSCWVPVSSSPKWRWSHHLEKESKETTGQIPAGVYITRRGSTNAYTLYPMIHANSFC